MTNLQMMQELRSLMKDTLDQISLLAGKHNIHDHLLTQLRSRQSDQDDTIATLTAKTDQLASLLESHVNDSDDLA